MFRGQWSICLVFAVCAVASTAAQAPKPILLTLESGADLGPGKIAVARGTASANQVRFAIDGLDVSQPVTVVVAATDPSHAVDVVLAKDNYDDPQQTAKTGADGTVTLQTRTQGDFGIGVKAAGAAVPFMLAVWVGDVTPPETTSFLAPVANYDAATLAKLKTTVDAAAPPAAAPAATRPGIFAWIALAIGAVVSIGILLIGVAMMRRKPQGGQ